MSAATEDHSQVATFFNKAIIVGFALSWLAPILLAFIDFKLGLGINPDVAPLAMLRAMLWILPIAAYLIHHPATLPLPQWLTFGHPVTFGGIVPNVRENPTLTLGVDPSGDWPCFPAQMKDRIVNLVGPNGWRYLIEFDARIIACVLFLVLNLGMLAWVLATARKPFDEEKRAFEACIQSDANAGSSELKDIEKQ